MTKLDRKQKKKAKRAVRKANAMEPYRPGRYLTPMDLMKRYYGNGVSYSGMSGGGAPSGGNSGLSGLLAEVVKIGGQLHGLLEGRKASKTVHENMGITETPPPVATAPEPTPPPTTGPSTPFARPPAPPMENRLVVHGRRRGRESDEYSEPLETQRPRNERAIVEGTNRLMEEGARRWASTRQRNSSNLLRIAGYENQLVEPNVSNIQPPHSNRAPPLLAIADGSALEEERPIVQQSDFTRRDLTIDDDDEGIVVPSSSSIVRFQEPVVSTITPEKAEDPTAGIEDLTQGEVTVVNDNFQIIPEQVEVVAPSNVSVLTEPIVDDINDDFSVATAAAPKGMANKLFPTRDSSLDAPPAPLPLIEGGVSENRFMADTMKTIIDTNKKVDDLVSQALVTVPGKVVKKPATIDKDGGLIKKMGIDHPDADWKDSENPMTHQRKEKQRAQVREKSKKKHEKIAMLRRQKGIEDDDV